MHDLVEWISKNSAAIVAWCGALSTFAIYSVLYKENRFYRLFEHIFIGLGAGYGVYITWSEVLGPKWWTPMVGEGKWQWVFAGIAGSMFYFIYSRRHVWISRVIFGLFMGLTAGGMFREFYELYFPQMGASMKPLLQVNKATDQVYVGWGTLSALIFYVIMFSSMVYFFFSFEHRHPAVTRTAALGRWFLMIGFGAIFGATVMGRMTLFIGRFNFLLNDWGPYAESAWSHTWFKIAVLPLAAGLTWLLVRALTRRNPTNQAE